MVTSDNLHGAAGGVQDKEARAKELAGMKKAELHEALGVDSSDDRTNEELQRAILAQEFRPQVSSATQDDDDDASAAALGEKNPPADLVSPNDPKAGLDRQHRTEVNRTKAQLDAMPKRTLYLPQRAPNDKRGPLPPVSAQINDYTYWVPRGVAVEVPEEVHRIIVDGGHMVAE